MTPPPKLFIPRTYQEEGTRFLLNNDRCNLFVEMGMGKSVMTVNAIDTLVRCGESRPTLILAPLRVARTTWCNEVKKWTHTAHLDVVPIVGDRKERLAALHRDAPIYTINYENIPWLVEQWGNKWPYRTIVADESSKLKSHRAHYRQTKNGATLYCTGGTRTSALARLAFKKTLRFWNLTGTPSSNALTDLWGQLWFVDGGERLGLSYTAFQDRWFRLGYNGYDLEALPHAEEEIRSKIADVTFTLRAEDYLDLGEEITSNIYVDLPPAAERVYRDMEKELFIEIKAGSVEVFTAAAKSQKCHQLANGAVYHDTEGSWEEIHKAKIEALQSVIEEACGDPLIVVYKFKSDLERLKKAIPQGVALDKNPKTEDDFRAGKIPVLFIHPDSAGHGIDGFQNACNKICFFSLDWNNELRQQVIARVGRVRQFQAGLNRPCFIYQIIARDTIDEIIVDRVAGKVSVEEALKAGLARRYL